MSGVDKQKKEARITIRLSKSDVELLNAKVAKAGYKAAGAFVRDYIANCTPKAKIGSDVVQIARELMNLTRMIRDENPGSELLKKVKHIAKLNTGGVQ